MATVKVDTSDLRKFADKAHKAARGDLEKELEVFLQGMGDELLEVVQNEIIRRNVVDTRLLLHSFEKGNGNNVWKLSDGDLTLEIGTNVKYAQYVNDGHWTNPKGVSKRFVPGVWNGDRFIYQPGAKTGMVLRQHWVEGKHYWESALKIVEKMYPQMLEKKMQQWLDKYFS